MLVLDSADSTSERVWHQNASTRGTWAIYQSCIITIGLCVWQSIHLNIPPPYEVWYKQSMRKVGFALTALIAPELVAFVAWQVSLIHSHHEFQADFVTPRNQYREAKEVVKAVNESRGIPQRPWRSIRSFVGKACWVLLTPIHFLDKQRMSTYHPESQSRFDAEIAQSRERRHGNANVDHGGPWTTAMGFYAACGGLVGRRDHGTPKALTVPWIVHIAKTEPHLLPILHHDEIIDKSKASILAKLITCIQAFWFCTSCVARLCSGNAISVLELNTFGHCICAFIIYVFWWHKPYDVTSHSVVDHDLCRFENLFSRCSGSRGYSDGVEAVFNDPSSECSEVLAPPRRQLDSPLCVVELGCYEGLARGEFYKIADSCAIPGTGFVIRLAPRGWYYPEVSRSEARFKSMAVLTNQKFYCLWKEKLEL